MGLEVASFVSELVATNPVFNDKKRQGDDHIRLLKEVLQATLPNADKAFYFPVNEAKTANFSVLSSDMNKTFMVSTGSGEVTATLPSLTADDDGWQCHFLKTNTGTNALFIAPASGTLQSGEVSGLSACRRVIPGHRCTAVWDGTAWYVSRVVNVPVGSVIDFCGSALPVGYEWPNGQTLASASTKYREFYAINGNSGVVVDHRGRVAAGKDDMGGTSANRLTNQTGGLNGDTLLAAGGAETQTLLLAHLPSEDLSSANLTATTTPNATVESFVNDSAFGAGGTGAPINNNAQVVSFSTTIGGSVPLGGSDTPHNNVQPTVILNKILVVE